MANDLVTTSKAAIQPAAFSSQEFPPNAGYAGGGAVDGRAYRLKGLAALATAACAKGEMIFITT